MVDIPAPSYLWAVPATSHEELYFGRQAPHWVAEEDGWLSKT